MLFYTIRLPDLLQMVQVISTPNGSGFIDLRVRGAILRRF